MFDARNIKFPIQVVKVLIHWSSIRIFDYYAQKYWERSNISLLFETKIQMHLKKPLVK